jgi:hypothetical protein
MQHVFKQHVFRGPMTTARIKGAFHPSPQTKGDSPPRSEAALSMRVAALAFRDLRLSVTPRPAGRPPPAARPVTTLHVTVRSIRRLKMRKNDNRGLQRSGEFPMDLRIPALEIETLLEPSLRPTLSSLSLSLSLYIYIYIYIWNNNIYNYIHI